ncbi:MAG: alpha/beta hydrolase [Woeseiaceae bacterium]|nr:alpha/beta hydrolase [Woeseiaceae bacterium]
MSSLRARLIRSLTSRYIRGIDFAHADVGTMRKRLDQIGRLTRIAKRVAIEKGELNGLKTEWYRPENGQSGKVLLYLHGGAFVLGSCDSHRKLVTQIARAGRIDAVMPEYRLAPEHQYPVGLQDCVGTYRALLEYGYRPDNIVVAGDSAGGGLTMSLMLELRHIGIPLPAAAVLISPFLDFTASGESVRTRADQDPWFRADEVDVVIEYYCPGDDLENPLLSPVFANVAGLPPTLVQVGDDEILLSDSLRIAEKMKEAGVEVELQVFPEMWHVFQLFVGKMPESRVAVDGIGKFIRDRFSTS